MTNEEEPEVVMVPVRQHRISFTLEDILTPLIQAETTLNPAGPRGPRPRVSVATRRQVQRISQLANQLMDAVHEMNRLDPNVLAPRRPEDDDDPPAR